MRRPSGTKGILREPPGGRRHIEMAFNNKSLSIMTFERGVFLLNPICKVAKPSLIAWTFSINTTNVSLDITQRGSVQ